MFYTFEKEDEEIGSIENTLSFIEYSKLYSSGWPFKAVDKVAS